jgi:hypothetical protein
MAAPLESDEAAERFVTLHSDAPLLSPIELNDAIELIRCASTLTHVRDRALRVLATALLRPECTPPLGVFEILTPHFATASDALESVIVALALRSLVDMDILIARASPLHALAALRVAPILSPRLVVRTGAWTDGEGELYAYLAARLSDADLTQCHVPLLRRLSVYTQRPEAMRTLLELLGRSVPAWKRAVANVVHAVCRCARIGPRHASEVLALASSAETCIGPTDCKGLARMLRYAAREHDEVIITNVLTFLEEATIDQEVFCLSGLCAQLVYISREATSKCARDSANDLLAYFVVRPRRALMDVSMKMCDLEKECDDFAEMRDALALKTSRLVVLNRPVDIAEFVEVRYAQAPVFYTHLSVVRESEFLCRCATPIEADASFALETHLAMHRQIAALGMGGLPTGLARACELFRLLDYCFTGVGDDILARARSRLERELVARVTFKTLLPILTVFCDLDRFAMLRNTAHACFGCETVTHTDWPAFRKRHLDVAIELLEKRIETTTT